MAEPGGISCYQSRIEVAGKACLLRVMVNERLDPAAVVTVYRTSKIEKYGSRA